MELKTIRKKLAPAPKPTAAKKRAIPNSRKARFVFSRHMPDVASDPAYPTENKRDDKRSAG